MKKIIIVGALSAFLMACSSKPVQQSNIPLDMQAVQDYQQRVATGNTVDRKAVKEDNQELNQSDKYPKRVYQQVQPVIYPSIGVGMGYGHYRHRHYHHW